MVPGITDVLSKNSLAIIAEAATRSERGSSQGTEIGPRACGETEVPSLVGTIVKAPVPGRVLPLGLGHIPGFRPRGQGRILQLRSKIHLAHGPGDGRAAGVARSPDDWNAVIFVVVPFVTLGARTDMGPDREHSARTGRVGVPESGKVFIRQGRSDERIVPRIVAPGPASHNRGEFADLNIQVAASPRCKTKCVFSQPHLGAFIARIEGPVGPRLDKNVELWPELRIEEETQAGIEETALARKNQARSGRGKLIILQIERAAKPDAQLVVPPRERQRRAALARRRPPLSACCQLAGEGRFALDS